MNNNFGVPIRFLNVGIESDNEFTYLLKDYRKRAFTRFNQCCQNQGHLVLQKEKIDDKVKLLIHTEKIGILPKR